MSFSWTPHRFSGGALALDVANSVIMRLDEKARIDRFAVPEQVESFAEAASQLSDEKTEFPDLRPVASDRIGAFIELRENIDAYFRERVRNCADDTIKLARLLDSISGMLKHYRDAPSPVPVDLAAARSALRLICHPEPGRMKICPSCGWLFLDKSRNRSRNWCDMAVCGNRAKARLHYIRRKEGAS